MNTIIKTSILIIISVLCCGCEKENNEKENRIEYDGEVYPLSWGMANYVEHEGLYDYEILLLPQSMYYNDSSRLRKGVGTFIGFAVISSDQILEGSYSLPGEGLNERKAGQIEGAAMVTWPSEDFYIFDKEGKLDITRSRYDYEISFSGMEDGGLTVSAYYKGTLIGNN